MGSFSSLAGKSYTWMGFFITMCTLGIAFYYSVVTAWSLRYLWISFMNVISSTSIADQLSENPDFLDNQWLAIANGSWGTIIIYIIVVIAGVNLLGKGIRQGLEKANRILIPSLFILLLIIVVLVLQLPNGLQGLEYMFTVKWELFADPKVWIEALSQSAWSTGAGWGLMMTLSSYSREREDVVLNTFIGAFGNNTASIVAGMAIIPSVFALASSESEALSFLQAGNQSLTFLIIPKLFDNYAGGNILAVVFFLALFFAAFSSLLPMIELFMSNLINVGISRKPATWMVGICFIVIGFPSAYSLDFFNNQDWVWGVGLILSGLFMLWAVIKYNPRKFKVDFIDQDSQMRVSNFYFAAASVLNVLLAVFLIYWWLSQGYSANPWFNAQGAWNVFDVYSNASVITQWVVILAVGIALNSFLYRKFKTYDPFLTD